MPEDWCAETIFDCDGTIDSHVHSFIEAVEVSPIVSDISVCINIAFDD